MKKLFIMALSAIFVANLSAQEMKPECKKDFKQAPSKEERIEMDIKRLTQELYLSDKQAENFAKTYREYAGKLDELFQQKKASRPEPGKELSDKELDQLAKQRFANKKAVLELQEKYYDKFRKDLNARQVEKVLRLEEKPGCCGKGCDGKHGEFDKKHFDGKRADADKRGPRPEGRGPKPGPRGK